MLARLWARLRAPFTLSSPHPDEPVLMVPLDYRADNRKMRKLVVVLLLLMGVILLVVIGGYANIRASNDKADANADAAAGARAYLIEITSQIASCTDPAGECAQRGGSATEQVAAAIVLCSNTLPETARKPEVLRCIREAVLSP